MLRCSSEFRSNVCCIRERFFPTKEAALADEIVVAWELVVVVAVVGALFPVTDGHFLVSLVMFLNRSNSILRLCKVEPVNLNVFASPLLPPATDGTMIHTRSL